MQQVLAPAQVKEKSAVAASRELASILILSSAQQLCVLLERASVHPIFWVGAPLVVYFFHVIVVHDHLRVYRSPGP